MNIPTHNVRIDIATCPNCKRAITADAVVRVKVEQPKSWAERVNVTTPAQRPVSLNVTATPAIVGLDINHYCGEAVRAEEAR